MLRISLFAFIMFIGICRNLAVVTPTQPHRFSNDFVYPSDERQKQTGSSESSVWALPMFEFYRKEVAAQQTGKSNLKLVDAEVVDKCTTAATPTHARLLLIRYSNERIDNVLDYVNDILTDELEMNRSNFGILQANILHDSSDILFEMSSIGDANLVLQHYCKLLHELKEMPGQPSRLPFEVVSTERNFHDL